MTALDKYQRLEGPGLWSGAVEAHRREVVVSFGEATLVILDNRSNAILSHWSLPALTRLNPGEIPALYCPSGDTGEILELDDDTLIEAMEAVRNAVSSPASRRKRRLGISAAGTALLLLAAFIWLPGAIVRHTSSVVPAAKRAQIGRLALEDLLTDAPEQCRNALAAQAMTRLQERVFDGPRPVAVVTGLADTAGMIMHLPGGLIVVNNRLLDRLQDSDAFAGFLLAEVERSGETDPLADILAYSGVQATLHLLTTGDLPLASVAGYAARLLQQPAHEIDAEDLIELFERAALSPNAYAAAASVDLAAFADMDTTSTRPAMTDGDWVSFQNICSDM
jgi:hypothetical protein